MDVAPNKWITLGHAFISVLIGVFVRQTAGVVIALWPTALWTEFPLTPADLLGMAGALAAFVWLRRNEKSRLFSVEVFGELAKVNWPPRKETVLSTGIISIMLTICALILLAFDVIWGTVVKLLY